MLHLKLKMHDTLSAKLALAVSGSAWQKMAVSLWKLPRDGHVFDHLTKKKFFYDTPKLYGRHPFTDILTNPLRRCWPNSEFMKICLYSRLVTNIQKSL